MSEADTSTAPNVPFFKKRAQSKNVRKRNLSDDDEPNIATSSTSSSELSSVSMKRSSKRAPQTSHADAFQASSTSSANRLASKEDADKTVGVSYKASLEGNVRIDDATRTQEIDTAYDRDAKAVIDRHMRAVEAGVDDPVDSGLYKGMAGYKSHIQKGETTNSKIKVGPMRASANIRVTNRFDYQPDICKDYKETGYCGYGDSCIYMHDRGDYKAGWQLDKEWEEEQRAKKVALIEGLDDKDESSSDDDDEVPFACLICREEFKHPVVTKCNHYFCEKCALKRYAKTPKCAACQTPTGGLFNAVSKDFMKKVAERKAKIEDAARRRAEDDAANAVGAAADGVAADEEDTGMVEDLSVVGMGGVPTNLPGGGSDDSDDDDSD
ncbi:hypothetical protein CPC16_011647 [Podila verticillata]|nr:hypothetical protein BGZ52_006067 [Haplosporangium bisporale]KAF9216322.1 hypothetical protein BGZ59_010196 [Podila verticillata]KAF9396617.1 hypothetical protein CPC16_011647 [Podila verticillata]KAI9240117.1 MAG: hypothetical protein BYD32DRAFT_459111 [Podila humilis]KFH63871.1 hypothetical protein MVEG_10564 [Podila verticillata NRRL 6337]